MLEGEILIGYLDDLYLLAPRNRARQAYDIVTSAVRQHAGVEDNLGKTECWSETGGDAPTGISELNARDRPPVWKGDMAPQYNGVVLLGSPLGTPEFTEACAQERVAEEAKLLEHLPQLPSIQSAAHDSPRALWHFMAVPTMRLYAIVWPAFVRFRLTR